MKITFIIIGIITWVMSASQLSYRHNGLTTALKFIGCLLFSTIMFYFAMN